MGATAAAVDTVAAWALGRANPKKRKKPCRRMKKAASNADLRERVQRDGRLFDEGRGVL